MLAALLLIIVLFVILFIILHNRDDTENLRAYSFGFPTHGSYYGTGPLKGFPYGYSSYAGWGLPYWGGYAPLGAGPYARRGHPRRRGGWYYRNFIKPYLTGTCYSSSKDEDCSIGYSKTQKDSNNDNVIDENDEWLCCRDRDMF